MKFKNGIGNASNSTAWNVCFDEKNNRYTAELSFSGSGGCSYELYEINKEIFEKVGTFNNDQYESERLIRTGRKLYKAVNDRCGMPYSIEYDKNYRKLCSWADIYVVKTEIPYDWKP